MVKRSAIAFLAWIALTANAFASFTATAQPCDLSPDRNHPEILAVCAVEQGNRNIEIILVGQKPNKVREVRFQQTGAQTEPQTLKISARPLIDPETVAVMFVDFNFDGHKDFAIMPYIPAGENVRYLYFLYNPKSGRFVANTAMNAIVNPEVVSQGKYIRSFWRDSNTSSGWNLWKWHQNIPFIATRIDQKITDTQTCTQTTTQFGPGRPRVSAAITCP